MIEDEITARYAIQASAERTGAKVVNLAVFDRVGGYDALLLCKLDSPGHVAKYVTWRSHWLKGDASLPGVYWGHYHKARSTADDDFSKRYAEVSALNRVEQSGGRNPHGFQLGGA